MKFFNLKIEIAMTKHKQLLIICFILTGTMGFSQENLLTIQQAVETAYNNNAELNQIRAQLKQKESLWQNVGISQPEINYFKEGIGAGLPNPYAEKRFTISQEVEFPLTSVYRIKGLKHEAEAQKHLIEAQQKTIKANVKSKYIEVMYARNFQTSKENLLKLAQNLYNAVYTKFETGHVNNIDLTNTELQLEDAKNDLEQSEWLLSQAKYDLFYSMGLSDDQQKHNIKFSDSLITTEIDFSQIQTFPIHDKQHNYQASVHRLNASNFFLKEAKSNIFPDIRFSIYKQDYGSGFNFHGFEIGLSLPLWLSCEQHGEVKMATARQEEICWQQQEIKLNMSKQIEFAWQKFSASHSIISKYNESLKHKTQELQNSSLKAYQSGEINLFTLLNAQQIYLKSKQRYISALRDYYLQLAELEQYFEQEFIF